MPQTKVAILGGGIAALTAAFELTELDPQRDQFDITVHTIGWRLGGKGAVGRNPDAGYRAEEHGLHVWTGFYDNAFGLVDRLYEAMRGLGLTPPFKSREDAFQGINRCVLMEPAQRNGWSTWPIELGPHEGSPGAPGGPFLAPLDYLGALVGQSSDAMTTSADLVVWPVLVPDWVTEDEKAIGPLKAAAARVEALPSDPEEITAQQHEHLRYLLQLSQGQLAENVRRTAGDDAGRTFVLCEIALTIALGMLNDGVLRLGFDCIDHLEWTEWMTANGCSCVSLNSAVVRGCYDYVFGFCKGNREVAAGTGTRILLKLALGYRGSFFYLLRATMGELIFAPLYQVLRRRKVKFSFFTRIDSIELSADGETVEIIRTTKQATPCPCEYDPLIAVRDGKGGTLPSWPSHPKYELLEEKDALRGVDLESAWSTWAGVGESCLQRGNDFDVVVLGISLGAFDTICKDLVCRLPDWKNMVEAVKTTPTMAFQAWTTVKAAQLGPNPADTVLTGFAKPLDSWGDLSLMLPEENWAPYEPPKGLAYFCGSFPEEAPPPAPYTDPSYPKREFERARKLTLDWINKYLPALWPNIADAKGRIDWKLFFDPKNRKAESRLDAQYIRANINPSDRYVLSVRGSVFARMRADESGVENLYLAGDWVRTGINAGCIEAAVMAGRAAAGAIAGVRVTMPNSTDFSDTSLPTALLPVLDLLRKVGARAVGGVGEIEAFCVLVSLPIDFVKSRLPVGIEFHKRPASLLRKDTPEPKTHDMVLIFARQRNVRPGLLPFGGAHYLEVAQLIPDVVPADLDKLQDVSFSFMPNLLLDSLIPVVVGQKLYGFNKQLASIRADGDSFSARSPLGTINAWFERCGVPGSISQYDNIGAIRSKLEQPLVGVEADGSFIYSILNFNLAKAVVQPVKGSIKFAPPLTTDLSTLELDGQLSTPPWGFRFLSQWSLSLPFKFPEKGGGAGASSRRVTAEYANAIFKFPVRRQ